MTPQLSSFFGSYTFFVVLDNLSREEAKAPTLQNF
jgi:hypothetical protein